MSDYEWVGFKEKGAVTRKNIQKNIASAFG